jgi:hypothetical protein
MAVITDDRDFPRPWGVGGENFFTAVRIRAIHQYDRNCGCMLFAVPEVFAFAALLSVVP